MACKVFLDWDTPPSAIGIGDNCVDYYGQAGYIDCIGFCFQEALVSWVGDGFVMTEPMVLFLHAQNGIVMVVTVSAQEQIVMHV